MPAFEMLKQERALVAGAVACRAGRPQMAPSGLGIYEKNWIAGWKNASLYVGVSGHRLVVSPQIRNRGS